MPIIKCPECGKDISDKAENCPNCGNPLKPILIEQTAKKWKSIKLVGAVLFFVGFYLFMSNYQNGGFQNPTTGLGFTIAFVGLVVLIIGKFGTWWNHK